MINVYLEGAVHDNSALSQAILLRSCQENGIKDKIKRSVIINEYEEGGLKMLHIQSFYTALKMSWLHKLLDPFNHSPWKALLLGSMQKWGGSNILYLSKEGLEEITEQVNPF
jgi:hypothetical protein